MTGPRILRGSVAVLGALTVALGLSGCGDVNAGSAALAELDVVVDAWPETVGVDGSGSNTLPWAGSAEATVIVEADTEPERVIEMADELGGFLDDAEGGPARWAYLDLQVGSYRIGVAPDPDVRSERLDVLSALRSDDLVTGGFVGASRDLLTWADGESVPTDVVESIPLDEAQGGVRIVIDEAVPLDQGFSIARAASANSREFMDRAVVAQRADGRSAVTDSDGTAGGEMRSVPPVATLGLGAAIGRDADVAVVVATSDSLSVRLARSVDVDSVRTRFEQRASDAGISLAVSGGVVTDDGTASDAALAAAQTLDGRDGVESLVVSGSSLSITVTDLTIVPPVVRALEDETDPSGLTEIRIDTPDGVVPRLWLTVDPDELGELGEFAEVVSSESSITLFGVGPSSVRIELDDTSVPAMAAVFSSLRPFLTDGETFSVRGDDVEGAQFSQDFVVGDEIDIDVPDGSTPEAADFAVRVQAAWAASG